MKMISLALLSIAAIPAATIGARADELTALKKQIDALGARVSGIEAEPLPGATSEAVTVRRGQGAYLTAPERAANRVKADAGVTISVSPISDAAPTAELSISGETRVLLSTDVH
jgi:hypothetical protein